MVKLFIEHGYRDFLRRLDLNGATDFLRLPGIIICGHPDRNVSRVDLEHGDESLSLYLKKEHRVRRLDRLANLLAGFGFVSKSRKEAVLKPVLDRAGIPAPEIVASGECGRAAFLLLREISRAIELRHFLQDNDNPRMRRELARQLGAQIARLHNAGIVHRDLYSKHVLVEPRSDGFEIYFLDWQRARTGKSLSWRQRRRDLATLDATLADNLASDRERLACLSAYRRACRNASRMANLVEAIRGQTALLLRKRHVRELRQRPLPTAKQNLIWLDGEALCVTKQFLDEIRTTAAGRREGEAPAEPFGQGEDRLGGSLAVPEWLPRLRLPMTPPGQLERRTVTLPQTGTATLSMRQARQPFRWLWSRLVGKPLVSPEFKQAATLFRLERYGLSVPRLLAVGQYHQFRRTRSFLVTEPSEGTVPLGDWLASGLVAVRQRRRVLALAGATLRRLHQAGYAIHPGCNLDDLLAVLPSESPAQVVLRSVDRLYRFRRRGDKKRSTDLGNFMAQIKKSASRSDALRFLAGYLGNSPTAVSRTRIAKMLGRKAKSRVAGRRATAEVACP